LFPRSAVSQSTNQQKGGYGQGAIYEIELSANVSGTQGGGVWLWIDAIN